MEIKFIFYVVLTINVIEIEFCYNNKYICHLEILKYSTKMIIIIDNMQTSFSVNGKYYAKDERGFNYPIGKEYTFNN